MTRSSRVVTYYVAAGLASLLVTMLTPGVSRAQCDPNWSHIMSTGECRPPPPAPPWWTPPPVWAPIYAPQWIPPPPARPPGAPVSAIPVWDQGRLQWVWVLT